MLSSIRLEINNGKFNPADWTPSKLNERKFKTKIKEWLDHKIEEAEANELSFETIKNYKGYVNNYFLPFFKNWDVREIRLEQLEEFSDSLRSRVTKIKTRRNILNGLHSFFSWLKRRGTIIEMPIWPIVKGNNSSVRTALDFDVQQFGLSRMPEEHRDIFEFGFETGLRPGETCALQVGDIDLKNRKALIQRTWSGAHLRETTKGGEKKYIPLSKRAYEIAQKNCKSKLPSVFLFTYKRKPYRPKRLNNLWKQHSELAGITHYDASRHSFCTQIIQSGANVFDAQELMRHKDIRSTRKYYHSATKRLQDIVDRRSKVLALQNECKTKNQGVREV